MRNIIKISLALSLATPLFTSCLVDFTPTNKVTQDQVNVADKNKLASAIPAYLNQYDSSSQTDIGYGGFVMWKDCSTPDMPVYSSDYEYYWYVGNCTSLGYVTSFSSTIYRRYYALIQKANLVFEAVDVDRFPDDAEAATNACAYRANAYMELAQWFEYKKTGFPEFDNKAEQDGIYGLTVPIVTEKTTDTESRKNPRAPFYQLFRFVLTDLNNGEKYCEASPEPSAKTDAGAGVIYGLKARFWLTVGTRFELHPEDLATALSHENDSDIPYDKFGVTTPKECFRLAAQYARKAINTGYTPLSETQWFDPTTGFNTVNNAWMWANIINSNNGLANYLTWQSYVSYKSPEATFGICTPEYGAYRLIDARLYDSIDDSDWRKTTWIDPDDVADETAFNTKYARGTSMGYSEWKDYQAYCGFKFHPGNGDRKTTTVANAVSIPLMRVEEMYLIEAEAVGRCDGEGAGRSLLEAFMNGYRSKTGTYRSTSEGIEGLIDDIFTQKRIEFWGEGLILWDYRRLEKAMIRGYVGTNWVENYRFNSNANAVAPWTTLSIPQRETQYNTAIIHNPDPSSGTVYTTWKGN